MILASQPGLLRFIFLHQFCIVAFDRAFVKVGNRNMQMRLSFFLPPSSHYVAFVKAGGRKSFLRVQEMLASLNPESHHGSCNGFSQQQQQQQQHEEDGQWLFFDSMAGRVGLKSGYNIPRVIYVEDFNEWVSLSFNK